MYCFFNAVSFYRTLLVCSDLCLKLYPLIFENNRQTISEFNLEFNSTMKHLFDKLTVFLLFSSFSLCLLLPASCNSTPYLHKGKNRTVCGHFDGVILAGYVSNIHCFSKRKLLTSSILLHLVYEFLKLQLHQM